MDHTTLLVTLIVGTVWAVLFVLAAKWDDIEAWWRHHRAAAARRRVRPLRYIPQQRSAR